MAYRLSFTANFGSHTPASLRARLFNTSGTQVNADITTGFSSMAGFGNVIGLDYASIPDGHRGTMVIFDNSDTSKFVAISVNPEEAERLDFAISTRSEFDHTSDEVTTDAASRTASQADVSGLATTAAVGAIPTNPLLANDARLDNYSTFDHASDVVTTDAASRTASQADVSGLATTAAVGAIPTNPLLANDSRLDNYSTFDHASDEVTTDAASRTASQADVSGLATTAAVGAIPTNPLLANDARLDNYSTFDHASDVVTTDAASRTASQANVSGLATSAAVGAIPTNPLLTNDARLDNYSTFDAASDEVTTDAASRTASQANVSGLATAAAVGAIPTNPLLANDSRLDNYSTFDHASDEVTTDAASRTASQADVSNISVDEAAIATAVAAQLAASEVDLQIVSALSETGDITVTKNETLIVTLSGLSIPSNVSAIYFTAQDDLRNDDSEAIVQIVSGVGLTRLNGADATAVSVDGSLTYDQLGGTVDIVLADDAIALIRARTILHYDVKYVTSSSASGRLAQGRVHIQWTATKAV